MKKLYILIFILFLCSCGNKEKKEEKVLDSIIIHDIKFTSDSISFSVEKPTNLNYKLYKDDDIVSENIVFSTNEITNLNSDTNYKLVVSSNNNNKVEEYIKTEKITTLRFGGDVIMSNAFENYIKSNGVDYMWSDVSNLFNSSDYSIVNLETSVSLRGSDTKPKGYGFRAMPDTLKGLTNAGIDMVSISNNHVLDYGYDAFLDTMTNLDNNNISYVGAGVNYNEASSVVIKEINGLKIGFFGASSIYVSDSWVATDSKGGIMSIKEQYYDKIYEIVDKNKDSVDYLVFLLHFGREHTYYPEDFQVELAHNLIDRGVDVIVGHHSHSLHGVEYYKQGIIFYSLGNFNFLVYNDNARKSGVFELKIDSNKIISSRIYPVYIKSCKANILENNTIKYNDIISIMNERSAKFNTGVLSDGYIIRKD